MQRSMLGAENYNSGGCGKEEGRNALVIFGYEAAEVKDVLIATYYDSKLEDKRILGRFDYHPHASIVYLNNSVFILGGLIDGTVGDLIRELNMKTRRCRAISRMLERRAGHGVAAVGETIIICGGQNPSGTNLSSCEVFRPKKNIRCHLPDMNVSRQEAAVVALADCRVFVFGGQGGDACKALASVEFCYLPSASSVSRALDHVGSDVFWRPAAPMNMARVNCATAALADRIFVAGGCRAWFNHIVEVFTPPTIDTPGDLGQWTVVSYMRNKRFDFCLVQSDQRLWAFGNVSSPSNEVECFQPSSPFSDTFINCYDLSADEDGSMSSVCDAQESVTEMKSMHLADEYEDLQLLNFDSWRWERQRFPPFKNAVAGALSVPVLPSDPSINDLLKREHNLNRSLSRMQ